MNPINPPGLDPHSAKKMQVFYKAFTAEYGTDGYTELEFRALAESLHAMMWGDGYTDCSEYTFFKQTINEFAELGRYLRAAVAGDGIQPGGCPQVVPPESATEARRDAQKIRETSPLDGIKVEHRKQLWTFILNHKDSLGLSAEIISDAYRDIASTVHIKNRAVASYSPSLTPENDEVHDAEQKMMAIGADAFVDIRSLDPVESEVSSDTRQVYKTSEIYIERKWKSVNNSMQKLHSALSGLPDVSENVSAEQRGLMFLEKLLDVDFGQ